MKILIRNLDRKTTEEELKALFEEFGDVKSCDLVIDVARKASKGFGFCRNRKSKTCKKKLF